ncbi:MAG: transposase [Sedimentisphaerales bacterium]|nr:transposase [Sedimentisphaerales bacterium]
MTRPLRIEYPGAFYHVINRGHRQETIVMDERDKERFLSCLERMARQFSVLVHSYCLMTNHYHLILETPEGNLSRALQWLNVSYATYYNRRHHYVGHLFQGRFKAVLVDAGEYLEALSRYIHLNPVRAGIESYAWDYTWSSCRYFVGSQNVPGWLEVNRILAGFSRSRREAKQLYAAYLSEADPANPLDDVVGSSLLGPKHFIEWVKSTFLSERKTDREIPQLKELKPRPDVETIVEEVAKHFKVTPEHILISGCKHNIGRDVAIYLSREFSRLSCQQLGRYFGGISGANITMRFNSIAHSIKKDRKLTKDITYLRNKIINS